MNNTLEAAFCDMMLAYEEYIIKKLKYEEIVSKEIESGKEEE